MGGRRIITEKDIETFENMKDGVLIHDGKVIYANRSLLNMFGAGSLEDVVGMDVMQFVSPEYRSLVKERIKLALERDVEIKPMVEKIRTLTGDTILSEVIPYPAIYRGKNVVLIFIKSEMTKEKEKMVKAIEIIVDNLSNLITSPGDPYEKLGISVCKLLDRILPDTGFTLFEVHGYKLDEIFSDLKCSFDIDEIEFDEIFEEKEKYTILSTSEGYVSLFASVVEVEGEAKGLVVFSKKGYGAFSPWDLNSLKLISRNVAVSMRISMMIRKLQEDRERYRNLAMKDPLTGAYTRVFFDEWIDKYQSYLTREGGSASLVVVDLDCLKTINDNFGHAEGDRVLKDFSSAVSKSIRDMDVFVRIGGDEFLIVFPEMDSSDVEKVMERIRRNLNDSKISFSYGVAEISKDQPFQRAFQIADMRMYSQKKYRRCEKFAR